MKRCSHLALGRDAVAVLAIMVGKGNPKQIRGLSDLARPDLRLAMPDIQYEGVARQIQQSLVKAGARISSASSTTPRCQTGRRC